MGQMLAPKHICAYPMRPAERLDDSAAGQCRIPTEEKIAGCQTPPVSDPALRQVMRPIMRHAAALTERQEVFPSVVGRTAVEMRPGEHSSETELPPQASGHRAIRPRRSRQGRPLLFEPPPVRQVADASKVWSPHARVDSGAQR